MGVLPQATLAPAARALGPGDTLLLYTDGLDRGAHRTRPRRACTRVRGLRDFVAAHAAARWVQALVRRVDDDARAARHRRPRRGPALLPAMDHSR